MKSKVLRISTVFMFMTLFAFLFLFAAVENAYAEGSKDLCENGGYRPYTERYGTETAGEARDQIINVYLKKGETVYFGDSVCNATLGFTNAKMGTAFSSSELSDLNNTDIIVMTPDWDQSANAHAYPYVNGKRDGSVLMYQTDNDANEITKGYIANVARETNGPNYGTRISGYTPYSLTAEKTGMYRFKFFSASHNIENPAPVTTAGTWNQKGACIAAWDATVVSSSGSEIKGRVFTDTLFMNMGSSLSGKDALKSKVYAVTDDGYQYLVDFNGMDPFGFVFFANNRGLLTDENSAYRSLYHSVRSNYNSLSDLASHDVILNNIPTEATDRTYNLFFNKPDTDALKALGISDPNSGTGGISDFTFNGTGDSNSNEGYVGKGGTFSFTASSDISASSYQIELSFGTGNKVTLSNTLKKGAKNEVYWNGKDADGKTVPAGTYDTGNISIRLKGGEVHFPLMDVEQNRNGIKIERLNGSGAPDYKVYYDNSGSNSGSVTSGWTKEFNWKVGDEANASSGVDSSGGAMAYTNRHTANSAKGVKLLGDGDQTALDIWAYYDRTVSLDNTSFKLTDASFTVTKAWDNTKGTPASGNPEVTVTLEDSNGNIVTEDADGNAITNPVTYDTSKSATYTWEHLDPGKTYKAAETDVKGYDTTYGSVGKTVDEDGNIVFSETVTNTYKPASIILKKAWNMNGSTAEHPDSVTFSIYTDEDKTNQVGGAVTLNADNNWTATVGNLDSTKTYYVFENNEPTGYTVSGTGQVSGDLDGGYTSVITNSFNSGQYMSVGVFKYWLDGDKYRAYQPGSILITLRKNGVKVTKDALGTDITNPVTLNSSNSWYYIWPALVAKETSAKGYSIEETDAKGNKLGGYKATMDNMNFLHNFGFGGIENSYSTTSFTATKAWENGKYSQQPSSAELQLMQSTDGGNTWSDYGQAKSVDSGSGWKCKWESLPSYTSDNTRIMYRVSETGTYDGYKTSYGDVTGSVSEGYSETVTNKSIYTDVTVSKVWKHGTQPVSAYPASVNVTLYANNTMVDACALNGDNDWTYRFTRLPLTDGDGNAIVYSVKENPVDKYVSSGGVLSGSPQDGYSASFTNTYDATSFTVSKVWKHGSNSIFSRPTKVSVQLYANGSKYGSPVTLNSSNSWKHTWNGLDKSKKYTVREAAVKNYKVQTGAITGNVTDGYNEIITNTYDGGAGGSGAKTGDNADMVPFAIALTASATALIGLAVYRRRRN